MRFAIRTVSLHLIPLAAACIVDAECVSPTFTTSDPNGGWSNGGYYVHNNMWNASAGLGPETLSACSYKDWYVVSNQTNSEGAVKTFPNVHKDYDNVAISSFPALTSTFAASSPHVGIYDVAYDIWLNGVATAGSNEVMIWTDNYKQVPAGRKVDTLTLSGHVWDVWKTDDNGYIALVPPSPVMSGNLDLLALFNWIKSKGWIRSNSTVGQICFGVEIVATNGGNAKFTFTDFSISASAANAVARPARHGARADSYAMGRGAFTLTGRRVVAEDGPGRYRPRR